MMITETTPPTAEAPAVRLQEALETLRLRRRGLRILQALPKLRDASGDIMLELIEDFGLPEEEAIGELAELLDGFFQIDRGVEEQQPNEHRFAPALRWLEAKDRDFWASRLVRWLERARKRQAAEAAAAA